MGSPAPKNAFPGVGDGVTRLWKCIYWDGHVTHSYKYYFWLRKAATGLRSAPSAPRNSILTALTNPLGSSARLHENTYDDDTWGPIGM